MACKVFTLRSRQKRKSCYALEETRKIGTVMSRDRKNGRGSTWWKRRNFACWSTKVYIFLLPIPTGVAVERMS